MGANLTAVDKPISQMLFAAYSQTLPTVSYKTTMQRVFRKVTLIVCRTDERVDGVLGYEDFLPLTQEGHGLQVSSGLKNKVQLPLTYS